MITTFLDHFENQMADRFGHMMYSLGPFSRWGSLFNAVISGILVIGGVIALVTTVQPFLLVFAAALHAFFVLIAVRVFSDQTLYDRQLLADFEAEERERAE